MLASHAALRQNLKFLSTGNLARQQAAENTMKRPQIGLQKAMVTAKNDFIAECAAAYRSHKERDFHGQLITHRLAIKLLLQQQAQHVIPTFGQATLRNIRSSVKSRRRLIETKKAGDDSLFNRLIQQWLGQRKDMASSIAQTTLNDVLNAVQSGIDDGDGTDEIARGIDDVTKLSLARSRVIARTETHAAALFAQIETGRQAERDFGIKLVKEWLPTPDDRTRPDHADMGQSPWTRSLSSAAMRWIGLVTRRGRRLKLFRVVARSFSAKRLIRISYSQVTTYRLTVLPCRSFDSPGMPSL